MTAEFWSSGSFANNEVLLVRLRVPGNPGPSSRPELLRELVSVVRRSESASVHLFWCIAGLDLMRTRELILSKSVALVEPSPRGVHFVG